ncbi:hypothetical protein J3A83DRAFT_4088848, partial [Scleroderma citrinum]
SRGIGYAVTKSLLNEHNARVVAISRSKPPSLEQLEAQHTGTLLCIQFIHSTDGVAQHQAFDEARKKFGRIDSLVLNAGTLDPMGRIGDPAISVDAWKQHFDVNVFSLLGALRSALPDLRTSENGGRVVFISSGAATGGTPSWGAYSSGKAAMNSLTRTLAKEEPSIVSIALAPGKVDTDMQTRLRSEGATHMDETDLKIFIDAYQQRTLVKPDDVGFVIAALSLRAPQSLSGTFVRWDGPECKQFHRV